MEKILKTSGGEEKQSVTYDDIIRELSCIAFSDISQVYDSEGKLLEPHLLSEEAKKTVRAIKAGRDGVTEIRREDKLKALSMLIRVIQLKGRDTSGSSDLEGLDNDLLIRMLEEADNE